LLKNGATPNFVEFKDENENVVASISTSGDLNVTGSISVNGEQISHATTFISATGGTVTTYVAGGKTYQVHSFTSTGASTFSISSLGANSVNWIDYVVVAGGGAASGGGAPSGGGAGGFIFDSFQPIVTGDYSVSVGAAGADSSLQVNAYEIVVAIKGGVGDSGDGGSAGGMRASTTTIGYPISGQGNFGGRSGSMSSGGGGGAGGIGSTSSGGAGIENSIRTGSPQMYCAGGYSNSGSAGSSGWVSGGFGMGGSSSVGGAGQGIVILRYRIA
jgi:hypothetical protein